MPVIQLARRKPKISNGGYYSRQAGHVGVGGSRLRKLHPTRNRRCAGTGCHDRSRGSDPDPGRSQIGFGGGIGVVLAGGGGDDIADAVAVVPWRADRVTGAAQQHDALYRRGFVRRQVDPLQDAFGVGNQPADGAERLRAQRGEVVQGLAAMQSDQLGVDRPSEGIAHLERDLRADQPRIDLDQHGALGTQDHLDVAGAEVEADGIEQAVGMAFQHRDVVAPARKAAAAERERRRREAFFGIDAEKDAPGAAHEEIAADHGALDVALDQQAPARPHAEAVIRGAVAGGLERGADAVDLVGGAQQGHVLGTIAVGGFDDQRQAEVGDGGAQPGGAADLGEGRLRDAMGAQRRPHRRLVAQQPRRGRGQERQAEVLRQHAGVDDADVDQAEQRLERILVMNGRGGVAQARGGPWPHFDHPLDPVPGRIAETLVMPGVGGEQGQAVSEGDGVVDDAEVVAAGKIEEQQVGHGVQSSERGLRSVDARATKSLATRRTWASKSGSKP